MAKFSEKHLVEDYIIEQLKKTGWRFVPADQLEREIYEEPLLVSTLVRCIQRINKGSGLGDEEISKVLNELKLVTSGQEGAKRILNYYKFGVPVKFEKERVIKYVQLFDYGSPSPLPSPFKGEGTYGNEFVVTRQVYYSGRDKIRTDIMLYVNGIPLVNIECKDPELYKYVQIGVAAESKAKYFPIVPWQDKDSVKYHEWRSISFSYCEERSDEAIPKDEIAAPSARNDDMGPEIAAPSARNDKKPYAEKNSIEATFEMLEPNRLLDIVRNFLFPRVEMGNATKVITRYMQYRAANKIVDRVLTNLRYKDEIATPSARNDKGRA
jgi:type I restriction enzyme R subunit